MDILTLIKDVEKGKIDPLYMIHGEETFLVIRFLEMIKSKVAVGPMADFNYSRMKSQETSGAKVCADARSMPMMAQRRLIVIDEADKFKSRDLEALWSLVDDPVEQTCLVMIGTKFDLRKGFFKKANKRGFVHKADPLRENRLGAFISQRAKAKGVEMSQEAVGAVQVAVGADCSALDDAVERLGLYADGAEVNVRHVEEVVSSVRQHSIFELVDALGERRAPKMLKLLFELFANREEPIRINAMLARHIRQLLKARICLRERMDHGSMARVLGVPPFVVKKLVGQCGGFRGPQLEAALGRLAKADIELKSSRRPPQRVLEEALMDLVL